MCEQGVRYKPFHNQLAKKGFAQFMRELQHRALEGLAVEALRFESSSPFCRFSGIDIQDGTSFALKSTLARHFPGRWRKQKPAAVELHVDLELLNEQVNRVSLSPDVAPERDYLPSPAEMAGRLLLADRGYYDQRYFQALDEAHGGFIIRGMANINPVIIEAFGPDGQELNSWVGQRLEAISKHFKRYEYVDLTVRFDTPHRQWRGRLVVHRNPSKEIPREVGSDDDGGVLVELREQMEDELAGVL